MGEVGGCKIDRSGDIWCGLFAKKVIDRVGGYVAVGKPLTEHRRNPHDLLKDLMAELYGMILTERSVQFLEGLDLTSKTYGDAYCELADRLASANLGNEEGLKKYVGEIASAMRAWVNVCEKIE